jgi:hypothetical protein
MRISIATDVLASTSKITTDEAVSNHSYMTVRQNKKHLQSLSAVINYFHPTQTATNFKFTFLIQRDIKLFVDMWHFGKNCHFFGTRSPYPSRPTSS